MFGLSSSVKTILFQLNTSLLKVIIAEGHTHYTYGSRQRKLKPRRTLNTSQIFENHMQFQQLNFKVTVTPWKHFIHIMNLLSKIKHTYLSVE